MSQIAMNEPTLPNETATVVSPTLRIYAVVLTVGFCCGLLIVCVVEATKPVILQNRNAMRQAAILDVVRGASSSVGYSFNETAHDFEQVDENYDVFAGYDESGRLVGFAIETTGMGYQDNIRILYGYDHRKQTVIGIKVLESRETPGLGDRIEKDSDFLANFDALDVSVSKDAVNHPIEFVPAGQKSKKWQVDGITGATISSRATAEMLRESTCEWAPRIQSHLGTFQKKGR